MPKNKQGLFYSKFNCKVCKGFSKFYKLKYFFSHPNTRIKLKNCDLKPITCIYIGNSSPWFEIWKVTSVGYQFARVFFHHTIVLENQTRNIILTLPISKTTSLIYVIYLRGVGSTFDFHIN